MSTKTTSKNVAVKSNKSAAKAPKASKKSASAFVPVADIVAEAEETSTAIVLAAPTDLVAPAVEEPIVEELVVESFDEPTEEAQVIEVTAEVIESSSVTGSTAIYPELAAHVSRSVDRVSVLCYDRITAWLASPETRFRCAEESKRLTEDHKLTALEHVISLSVWCKDHRLAGQPGTNAPFRGRSGGLYRPGFQPKDGGASDEG